MTICITRSERNSYSETFIRDQIAVFQTLCHVVTIHSSRLPERREDNRLLSPWPYWIMHKLVKGITGKRNNYFSHFGLKKFFRQEHVDVVVANYGLAAAHLAPICRASGIPLIAIFHGHDATDKKLLRQYRTLYPALFRDAAAIVAVSKELGKGLAAMGCPSDKLHIISCGVDISRFPARAGAVQRYFLAVGRMVPKKGPLFTLRAFHQVWQKMPDVKLVMIGAHKGLYQECVQFVESMGMSDAVEFPGILPHREIALQMQGAIAFVQHSVTAPNGDTEGTPVSLLEASASSLPVVSTRHGGIPDAVVHGETGFLVDEGDVAGMAAAMAKLAADEALVRRMGEAGRNHITRYYQQQDQIRKLFALASSAATGVR